MLLKFDPYPTQLEACRYWIDQETEEIAFGGAKYGGKSHLGCNLIFADALIYPETDYFIARESLNDLRKYTVPSIHEVFQLWKIRLDDYGKFDGKDNFFEFNNGSRVLLLQAGELPSDPMFERFGSMQMTRGWIEEASQVSDRAKNNLKASVGRRNNDRYGLKGKMLYTCNPKKPHWLERDFYRPSVEGRLPPTRKFIRSLPTDNIKGNQDYINNTLAKIEDPAMRARLYEGSWDYDNDPHKLIDPARLANITTNTFVAEGTKCLICDVALEGSDRMVLSYFNGWRMEDIVVIAKTKAPEAITLIAEMAHKYGVERSNIVIDSDGIGGPIAHHFEGCVQFLAQGQVIDTGDPLQNFAHLKDQCAYRARDVINAGQFFLAPTQHEDALKNELGTWKRDKPDSDGKIKLLPKSEQKKLLGGKSPDIADTVLMRAVRDLRPVSSFGEVMAMRADEYFPEPEPFHE